MKKELTRRDLIGRVGLAVGGAMSLGALGACGGSDDTTTPPPPTPTPTASKVGQFPYQQHLPAGYQLDVAAVKEAAYHGYYAGGCCHGAYSALLKHLADTVGAPFDELPQDFGMFGGGGIASYGSICGAALAGVLVVNQIVPNLSTPTVEAQKTVRNKMMTEIMRWYEQTEFPSYLPTAVDALETETALTRAFNDSGKAPVVKLAPGSHLCHASVTGWCAANGNVASSGADKKARCARLTADVAGKVAELLNAYLATGEFVAAAPSENADCVGCHTQAPVRPAAAPVASGMECTTCHPGAGHTLPQAHAAVTTGCDGCH